MSIETAMNEQDIAHQGISGNWFTCKVTEAGAAEDGRIYIWLQDTNNAFSCWFSATPNMKDEMLETALAAITINKQVSVNLTGTNPYSVISRLYLVA